MFRPFPRTGNCGSEREKNCPRSHRLGTAELDRNLGLVSNQTPVHCAPSHWLLQNQDLEKVRSVIIQRRCRGHHWRFLHEGHQVPKLMQSSALTLSVLLLPASPGLRPGGAGLPICMPGSLQVRSTSGAEGRQARAWKGHHSHTLFPCSFKEWTLTTSLAQWPSGVSEVSSSCCLHPATWNLTMFLGTSIPGSPGQLLWEGLWAGPGNSTLPSGLSFLYHRNGCCLFSLGTKDDKSRKSSTSE